jgi:hypothetical protein
MLAVDGPQICGYEQPVAFDLNVNASRKPYDKFRLHNKLCRVVRPHYELDSRGKVSICLF